MRNCSFNEPELLFPTSAWNREVTENAALKAPTDDWTWCTTQLLCRRMPRDYFVLCPCSIITYDNNNNDTDNNNNID